MLKKAILYSIRLILCLMFGYSFITKTIKFSKGGTGTKLYKEELNGLQNLSMTICPSKKYVNHSSFQSLEEMPRIADILTIYHRYNDGNGQKSTKLDLVQEQEFLYMLNWNGKGRSPVRCLNIKMPFFQPLESGIMVEVRHSWVTALNIGFYPDGKCPFMQTLHVGETAIIDSDGVQRSFRLVHKISKQVNENCDMENEQFPLTCALEDFEQRTNCSFPWDQEKKMPDCTLELVKNEFYQFKMANVCLVKNCNQEFLKPDLVKQNYNVDEEKTALFFKQHSNEADVVEEYYLMDFSDFISAVGGDLGIFVGAGLMDLFEGLIELITRYSWRMK